MSWFTPKCPVDAETKQWLDDCFAWLLEEFGEDDLRETTVILPTEEFFPEIVSPDDDLLENLLRRVCDYMRVDFADVELQTFAGEEENFPHPLAVLESTAESSPCGLYSFENGKHHIFLNTRLLKNPVSLIATISHELAHAILIGEENVTVNEDEEFLTDLATIFFGMGIFTANSLFNFEQFTNTSYQGWRTSKEGYITEEMAGYFLALFAYIRNENKPEWMKFLEINPKTYCKQSLKYLEKTGEVRIKKI